MDRALAGETPLPRRSPDSITQTALVQRGHHFLIPFQAKEHGLKYFRFYCLKRVKKKKSI